VAAAATKGLLAALKPTRTTTPAVALPKDLAGTWTRTFTKREVGDSGEATGRYALKIQPGEIDVYEGPTTDPARDCITQPECASVEVEGRSGRVLTLGETPTCTGVGRYAFVVEGDTLKTKKVKDPCDAVRPLVFDGRSWKRAQ